LFETGFRAGAEKEKMRRVALMRFADFCSYLAPGRCRRFTVALLPVVIDVVKECSEPLMETLAVSMAQILHVLAFYCKEKEIREVIVACCETLKRSPSAPSKRACADIAAAVCKTYPRPEWEFCIVSVQPLLESSESSVVQGGLIFLLALAREAALFGERPLHRDPRVPLAQFAPQLIAIAERALSHDAPLVLQAAAELCARLPSALPWVVLKREETKPLRRALKKLCCNKAAGASRRASALQALAAWGGLKRSSVDVEALLQPDEDPLVRGSAMVALAKKRGIDAAIVMEKGTQDESSVVARLAYEAAAEFLCCESPDLSVAQAVVRQTPLDYWVVEKQRLTVIGETGKRWSKMTDELRHYALAALMTGLGNSDPRVRSEAANALCNAAPYLGSLVESSGQSDNDVMVLEGAWRTLPSIMCNLMSVIRCTPSLHMLFGAHEVQHKKRSFFFVFFFLCDFFKGNV
jgi:HEAT repeat protein